MMRVVNRKSKECGGTMTENKFPVEMILLDQLFANPWQIRKTVEATYIHELANKIAQMGLQEFPHARPMVDRPSCYELVFGHNRLAAYRLLLQRQPENELYKRIPVYVAVLTDRQMFEGSICENDVRRALNPIDRAEAIERYIRVLGADQTQAAHLFGFQSQGAVSNSVRLLRLPEAIKALVRQGLLSERKARRLLSVPEADAIRIAERTVKKPVEQQDSYFYRQLSELKHLSLDQTEQPASRRSVSQAAAPGFLPAWSLLPNPQPATIVPSALAQAKPKTEDMCPRCGQVPRVYRRLDDGWRCGQCNSRVGLITATL